MLAVAETERAVVVSRAAAEGDETVTESRYPSQLTASLRTRKRVCEKKRERDRKKKKEKKKRKARILSRKN